MVGAIEGAKCEFIISTIPASQPATATQARVNSQADEVETPDITIPNSEAENEDNATDYEDF